MGKARKLVLASALAATSMFAATPANAWTLRTFYDANGYVVGQQHVCTDTQHIIWQWSTSPATYFEDEEQGYGTPGMGGEPYYC